MTVKIIQDHGRMIISLCHDLSVVLCNHRLEKYTVPHATTCITVLGLDRQILWWHGTPERNESDNGTHFKNSLVDTSARDHGIEWIYHITYHTPASGKTECFKGLLKTVLKAMGG